MYLSRLEIHGFKSFADRTVVDFSPGITVVVGPNGCGKSNIVDAVRWVIGEQRARILRSEKMDNIIFNGTSNRRSLGMSEVLLTIENTRGVLPIEYAEVTIGRRLFRSGESEYLLNGVQCRLKDITDLFMDTGMGAGAYSVIELKMIDDILSESTQDRRHMFEEAAGITKYKIRRGQTLRKLDSTQTDLNRVRDLVEELDQRVSSLQRQAQKASRFKVHDERLHHLIQSLAVHQFEKLSTENSDLERSLKTLGDQSSGLTATLASKEADHEALRKDHVGKEQVLGAAQSSLADHVEMLHSAETDLRLNSERQEGISRNLERADEEENKAERRSASLSEQLERTVEELITAQPEAKKTSDRLAVVQSERDAVEKRISERRTLRHRLADDERKRLNDLSERRQNIERLTSRLELLNQEISESESHLENAEERLLDLTQQIDKAVSNLDEQTKKQNSVSRALETARAKREEQQTILSGSERDLHSCERKLDAVNAELVLLESILSSYDDLSDSVQFLADSAGWMEGQPKTVADIIACDSEYVTAVTQALGPFASYLVVPDEKAASRAISKLQDEEKGRATFLIMSRLSDIDDLEAESQIRNAVSFASLVRTPGTEYDRLANVLLRSCYLVEDIEAVQHAAPGSGRFYTKAGEWYDTVGLRYGGSEADGAATDASRLGRHVQLKHATDEHESLCARLNELQNAVENARGIVDSLPVESLELELQSQKETVVEAEKQFSQVSYEREVLLRRRDEITGRKNSLIESTEVAQKAVSEITGGLEQDLEQVSDLQYQVNQAESELTEAETKSRETFSRFNEANIVAVQAANRVETLEREEQRTKEDQKTLDEESQARATRILNLRSELSTALESATSLDVEIKRMRKTRGELDKAVSVSKDALMEIKISISELEVCLRDLRREREQTMADEAQQSIRKAEIKTRLDDLVQTIQEDYEIILATYELELDADFSATDARLEISTLRSKIRNLGPINALALDSFEDEKERLDFLRKQLSDLEHAESTLVETIDEINLTASRRFDTTFSSIQDNFSRLFTELFGEGATAQIVLEDPTDPLESPIEVLAKPSGKKPSVLAQLSGGEKTLTAIALLFSIYLVKPSPFCILDEVDAPLDDPNIDRFMKLIRSFADSTQFVLVTHNKRTMEAADRMYGITMPENGVSQLVGVSFDPDLQLVA
ncbi:MAG: chromosome segregation protein SMC [Rhodothermia bacterium]|nr:MAG: chromosome segregation protein SMC [Rhodothermia bacterium]